MKIVKGETFILHIPLQRSISAASHTLTFWALSGLILHGENGMRGTGFTAIEGAEAIGEGEVKSILDQSFLPAVVGRDSLHIREIWNDCYKGRVHWYGRSGITLAALSALDIALWDLNSKAAGLPLWKYLGAAKRGPLQAYNTDAGWLNLSREVLVSQVKELVSAGWSGVKIKIGRPDPREDMDRLRAVREAIGWKPKLMVDVNMGWTLEHALVWAPHLAEYDVGWLEEPFHPDDLESYAILARQISTPLATGENISSKFTFRDYLKAGALIYLQPDCTRVGGITEWLDIAGLAACWGLPVVPHLGDGAQVHQHLVAATSASTMIEYVPWLKDCFETPVRVKEGKVLLPLAPGASTTLGKNALKKHRVA